MKKRGWMAVLVIGLVWGFGAGMAGAEEGDHEADASMDLEAFRARIAAAAPVMEVEEDLEPAPVEGMDVAGSAPAPMATPAVKEAPVKVAIFAKNNTTRRGLDEDMDALRGRIGASLAGKGMVVLDAQDIASSFNRFKVTTAEEKAGLIDGLFSGGSVVRVAQMIGADYLVLVAVDGMDVFQNTVAGRHVNTLDLMASVNVLEAVGGTSVDGDMFDIKDVTSASINAGNELNFFRRMILRDLAPKVADAVVANAADWRRPAATVQMVRFTVRTNIDELIDGLEAGARGPNELLDELRRMVGGVSVQLNGATIGSAPGTFEAPAGLHQLRLTRQWMQPWQNTVSIQDGSEFVIALELSDAGLRRYQSLEGFKAMAALTYAEAAYTKDIKINFDTAGWQDVAIGNRGNEINLEKNVIRQEGFINQVGE
ncbi:MAG TPA: PEGA domain-containing protein [Kiritimatiellia bacterium]|nr:PEGA domain-containing protein [Kiritimatiellia bacterium]